MTTKVLPFKSKIVDHAVSAREIANHANGVDTELAGILEKITEAALKGKYSLFIPLMRIKTATLRKLKDLNFHVVYYPPEGESKPYAEYEVCW